MLQPPFSCCFLGLWWVGLSPSLVSSMKIIPVERSEVSASVWAGLAAEKGYRLGALCDVLCLSVCVCVCLEVSASEDVSLCEKCCSKHPEHCSNILASDVTKQQLQEDRRHGRGWRWEPIVKREGRGWTNHEAGRGTGGRGGGELNFFGEYKSAVITVRAATQCATAYTKSKNHKIN